ncbi:helix-turn-helix domain-containing protein [Flavobacterium plurextorum]|uniref:helix-turn-helix domain-containing protein n=2 Tax=Flavobacterium plurextorum TaxID=1114867 RepID=UPI003756DEE6
MIIEIITTELDFYIMEKIRELRIKAGLDQVDVAQKIGVSEGYIGNIENPKHSAKVNIRMLARIANAIGVESYNAFLPDKIFKTDMVRLKIKLLDISSRSQTIREDGTVPERLNVLSKKSLTDDDLETLKLRKGGLKYCTIIEK